MGQCTYRKKYGMVLVWYHRAWPENSGWAYNTPYTHESLDVIRVEESNFNMVRRVRESYL